MVVKLVKVDGAKAKALPRDQRKKGISGHHGSPPPPRVEQEDGNHIVVEVVGSPKQRGLSF